MFIQVQITYINGSKETCHLHKGELEHIKGLREATVGKEEKEMAYIIKIREDGELGEVIWKRHDKRFNMKKILQRAEVNVLPKITIHYAGEAEIEVVKSKFTPATIIPIYIGEKLYKLVDLTEPFDYVNSEDKFDSTPVDSSTISLRGGRR